MFRIGFSKDIHRLVKGRKLKIGGVIFDYPLGEDAHSDGDVLYHAVAESILGALALGDLGKFFPDNKAETLNMNSDVIVNHVCTLMQRHEYEIANLDCQIILEKPKLADSIMQMRENLALLLNTNVENISVKAGTNEKMDSTGRNEAIEAYATVLLKKKFPNDNGGSMDYYE